MVILEIDKISKSFGSVVANKDISLTLNQGEILALLGENGAGKTTLMNILFGQYSADSGQIKAWGKVLPAQSTDAALKAGIGMVHQHFTLAENMTVLENVMLGTQSLLSWRTDTQAARAKIANICQSMNLSIDVDLYVADLSIGERQGVEILKALYRDAKILILDEPTAVLTPQEVEGLFEMLRSMQKSGLSVIIISHKLDEILAISQNIVVLRQGQQVAQVATATVDRGELAELIVGKKVPEPINHQLAPGEPVLHLEKVNLFKSSSEKYQLTNINLLLRERQIIGIAGVSGNGQRELAAVISGVLKINSGKFEILQQDARKLSIKQLTKLQVARIPEDRHSAGIVGDMSVWENLMLEDLGANPCWRSGFLINTSAAKARAEQLIEKFDIRCANMNMPAKLLSGGNIQKLILARNFQLSPKLVLANQPVRGLDEGAISFVHQQLLDAKAGGSGVLLISEDLDELLRLSDFVQVMHDGKLSKAYPREVLTPKLLGILMSGGQLDSADHAADLATRSQYHAV
ncbi:MAG: ABC transporter ATP-binding protein [Oceanospirillaceae bacterium]|nr:ABC transporter ATP-binding protein [Oceanospirillaceae bacterium]